MATPTSSRVSFSPISSFDPPPSFTPRILPLNSLSASFSSPHATPSLFPCFSFLGFSLSTTRPTILESTIPKLFVFFPLLAWPGGIAMVSGSLLLSLFLLLLFLLLLLRFVFRTSLVYILVKYWQSITDRFHVYQHYRIPQYNHHFQENQLYRAVSIYLNSLPSLEDSDFTNLFSGTKPSDIFLQLDSNQTIRDSFLGAKMFWTNDKSRDGEGNSSIVLKLKRREKRRVFRQYLQHILSVSEEIELRNKEIRLHMNISSGNGRWKPVPFTHPATFETVLMDVDLKNKVKSDLEHFMKAKQYYHRLGRVWKRSYLLYGQSGTGKTSFVAAMAKFLGYDVFDIDMSKVSDDSDLKALLLQTTPKSLIVIEDLDRMVGDERSPVSLSGMLNFMDGIWSCCGEERVMVFTMKGKKGVDERVLRPGRVDVHIEFPACDFTAFKSMASSYLGVKDHKLFPQVEEMLESGGSMSQAEMGEIMIANRNSPSRALKWVISALQSNGDGGTVKESESRESVHGVGEFRKLYGLLRIGSRRKEEAVGSNQTEKNGLSRLSSSNGESR